MFGYIYVKPKRTVGGRQKRLSVLLLWTVSGSEKKQWCKSADVVEL